MRYLYAAGLVVPAVIALAGVAMASPQSENMAPIQVAQATTVILAPTAPPPPREDVPPPPPSGEQTVTQVWETGHWAWNGSDWAWVHGQYVVRPATVTQTATWQAGHWVQQSNGWLWVEGHWQ